MTKDLIKYNKTNPPLDDRSRILYLEQQLQNIEKSIASLYTDAVALRALYKSTSYANDTAAAAGGVAVGQFYRNGSALMVRVT